MRALTSNWPDAGWSPPGFNEELFVLGFGFDGVLLGFDEDSGLTRVLPDWAWELDGADGCWEGEMLSTFYNEFNQSIKRKTDKCESHTVNDFPLLDGLERERGRTKRSKDGNRMRRLTRSTSCRWKCYLRQSLPILQHHQLLHQWSLPGLTNSKRD